MEEFPSGQRGQTVNLLLLASVVRIHPPPPEKRTLRLQSPFFCEDVYKRQEEITDITVLKKGMTNRSFLFTCKGKKYICLLYTSGHDRRAIIRNIKGARLPPEV